MGVTAARSSPCPTPGQLAHPLWCACECSGADCRPRDQPGDTTGHSSCTSSSPSTCVARCCSGACMPPGAFGLNSLVGQPTVPLPPITACSGRHVSSAVCTLFIKGIYICTTLVPFSWLWLSRLKQGPPAIISPWNVRPSEPPQGTQSSLHTFIL